jgi:hypothetical protein
VFVGDVQIEGSFGSHQRAPGQMTVGIRHGVMMAKRVALEKQYQT